MTCACQLIIFRLVPLNTKSMNSNPHTPTASHRSSDENELHRNLNHAASSVNSTPITPRVFYAGDFLNSDSISPSEINASHQDSSLANLPRLPHLLNADDFVNGRPPLHPYARDVDFGRSGDGLPSPYSDGSSDGSCDTRPVDVFIDGVRTSPFRDRDGEDELLIPARAVQAELNNAAGDDNNVPPIITADTVNHAFDLISNNPLRKLMRLKGWTKAQIAEAKAQDNSENISNYIANVIDLPFCFNKYQKSFTDCRCVAAIDRALIPNITDMLSKLLFFFFFLRLMLTLSPFFCSLFCTSAERDSPNSAEGAT